MVGNNKSTTSLRVRRIVQSYFSLLISFLVIVGVIKLEISGTDLLNSCGNKLVLANHPSYLDIVILLSILPNACCIINSKLLANPFIGWIVRAANYISNDSDAERLVDDCVKVLKKGGTLIIFPEGTRSIPNQKIRFHRGSAHIALRSGADIQLLIIHCNPPLFVKGTPWYKIPKQASKFTIGIKSPIKAQDAIDITEPDSIAARKLTRFMEEYYSKEISAA